MPTTTETLTRVDGNQFGLKWERDTFSLTPVWTVIPSLLRIKDICAEFIGPSFLYDLEVRFLDEGTFNRVYRVDAYTYTQPLWYEHVKYIFRVSLPVDPWLKSSSEVATIKYLNECTNVPVTKVLQSFRSPENPLGFEWMLQTYVPGQKLSSIWQKLGDSGRERMIRQLAEIQTHLFKKAKFCQIGNIYDRGNEQSPGDRRLRNEDNCGPHDFYVGKIVSNSFILKGAVTKIVNRGPFRTSADWLSAQLGNVMLVCDKLQESPDKNDLEAAERSREIAQRLLNLLPKLFPVSESEEQTVLHHDDLSQENIFCFEDGTITAILDWEATSCLPLWVAYDMPQLLQGASYSHEPDPSEYRSGTDDLLFRDRLLMWQRWKLKKTYIDAINRTRPEQWGEYEENMSRRQRDFRNAVEWCDSELSWNMITNWLDRNDQLQDRYGHEYFPLNDEDQLQYHEP